MNCKLNHSVILSVTCYGLGNFPPLIHNPSYPFVDHQNPTSGVGWVMKGVLLVIQGWGWVGWVMLGWGEVMQ